MAGIITLDGTNYNSIIKGKVNIEGTIYDINEGKTNIEGVIKTIPFIPAGCTLIVQDYWHAWRMEQLDSTWGTVIKTYDCYYGDYPNDFTVQANRLISDNRTTARVGLQVGRWLVHSDFGTNIAWHIVQNAGTVYDGNYNSYNVQSDMRLVYQIS